MAGRQGAEPVTMGGYTDLPPEQRPGYAQQATPISPSQYPGITYAQPGNVQYSNAQYSYASAAPNPQGGFTRTPSNAGNFQYAATPEKIQFTAKPVVPTVQPPPVRHTAQPSSPPYQNAQPQYAMPQAPQPPPAVPSEQSRAYPPPPMGRHSPQAATQRPSHHRAASHNGPPTQYGEHKVVEIVPGGGMGKPSPSPGGGGGRDGLSQRMDRLSVSGNRPDIQTIVPGGMPGGYPGGGLPPPSPLLEAYHGTWQSISPMPHAKMLDDDLDHLPSLDSMSPRGSSTSVHGSRRRGKSTSKRSPSPSRKLSRFEQDKMALQTYGTIREDDHKRPKDKGREKEREKEKRRVKIYDAEQDALDLVDALSGRNINNDTILDIIPALSHDQILELRNEYKRHCKIQGRGINIAKHIKLKISGNFGKIAYVTALGKYESEGYWANYWYQSNSARRELLIESLMGRQNHEMREILRAFKDKRYGDSLVKCMDKELKADKFRKAVLLALEAERQEESDAWPTEYRNRDVDMLHKAIRAREGGETMMLEIVVMRSDSHLREVLRTYERKYGSNFARDALRKSNNLVGEVIAHILNGVINRPARDAMLLHHALMDLIEPPSSTNNSSSTNNAPSSSKHDRQQRHELLISRLVRLHWDRLHLSRVKMEYEEKYGKVVEEDLEEAVRGDFREFCLELCQTGAGGGGGGGR
ncbi:Annexin [Periconia macrospinosa]|uniref:Annexin n=1 Tax=Periconia macrospinosa TaxID=97972 RepID=A0A2V1DHK5_9PLEO|nr:Annexin [Periconia macrospinosa]